MRTISLQKGFTLMETLIAITILVTAIAGPMTIAARGLQTAYYSKDEMVAVFLAQEAIELVRMKRDQYALANSGSSFGWYNASTDVNGVPTICKELFTVADDHGCGIDTRAKTFFDCGTDGGGCRLKYDSATAASVNGSYFNNAVSGGALSPYTRKLFIYDYSSPNDREIVVTARVSWQANLFSGRKQITIQERLFDHYR
ncbi:type II secretion system GspH family protein [Patescibacteria group bacterium]|nr:type II secretion system GspH family protein [Patescibacteria group bacterium]